MSIPHVMETFKISNVYSNYSRVIRKNPMNSENKGKVRDNDQKLFIHHELR